jgi:hypothetical protein
VVQFGGLDFPHHPRALTLALEPLFFIIDRITVFDTVPRDDYAPFLLWLAGPPGGAFQGSPYGYRLLTMVAAKPARAGALSRNQTPSLFEYSIQKVDLGFDEDGAEMQMIGEFWFAIE